ncbi:MAG TPA: DUF2382 domain-containing protein [Pyrinomonadaceae bacterium]|nr:DUF2382 domain-containing protein [Pyrinomonadaceae bacterium]
MAESEGAVMFDAEGARGTLEPGGGVGDGEGRVRVLLDDGRRLWLPPGEGARRVGDAFFFDGSFEELAGAAVVVPVVEEELRVGKRVVETGRVRVTKTVSEREELVDVPLVREEFDVERVPVNAFVDGPVAPRHEGETLVVPVLEEVLVVEKRLVVREELRITRRRSEEREARRVTLLSEEVSVERRGPRPEGEAADEDERGRHA